MYEIHRTLGLDLHNVNKVWHREIIRIMHMLSVVELNQVNVVMARKVSSSMLNWVTS